MYVLWGFDFLCYTDEERKLLRAMVMTVAAKMRDRKGVYFEIGAMNFAKESCRDGSCSSGSILRAAVMQLRTIIERAATNTEISRFRRLIARTACLTARILASFDNAAGVGTSSILDIKSAMNLSLPFTCGLFSLKNRHISFSVFMIQRVFFRYFFSCFRPLDR